MKFFLRLIFIVTSVLVCGCTATGPVFKEAAAAPQGKALVYVYRPWTFAAGGKDAHFFVDGNELVHLSSRGYTQVYLSEGRHTITQRWNENLVAALFNGGGLQAINVPFEAKAGEIYYFRFETGLSNIEVHTLPGLPSTATITSRLMQVSREIGSVEIVPMKFQPGKI